MKKAPPTVSLRLLFLSKRHPQVRDLFTRPYGRFFHLPKELAARGYSCTVILFDYHSDVDNDDQYDGLNVYSVGLRRNPLKTRKHVYDIVQRTNPHCIVGFSDIWYGIIAAHLARRFGTSLAIDAYDNYESYIPWAFPAHKLWHRAIAAADLITAAGQPLLNHMARHGTGAKRLIVPMSADPIFHPRNQLQCREALGLPANKCLIGYLGSIHPSRSTNLLLDAMRHFDKSSPDVTFIMSGRRLQSLNFPKNTRHLGYLPDEQVPVLLNSLDLVLVPISPSSFGNHSYPVKLYEAAACHIPFVAMATSATQWITRDTAIKLCPPDNLPEFIHAIEQAISASKASASIHLSNLASWEHSAISLDSALKRIIPSKPHIGRQLSIPP